MSHSKERNIELAAELRKRLCHSWPREKNSALEVMIVVVYELSFESVTRVFKHFILGLIALNLYRLKAEIYQSLEQRH